MATSLASHQPKTKVYIEKFGDTELLLEEVRLDVFEDVTLWAENPRLQPYLAEGPAETEEQLEAHLQQSKGYDVLFRSIQEVGQMEPIYVWRRDGMVKYLTLEGATRVTILRDLARRKKGTADEARFRTVVAKALPETFTEEQRVILLARIHVRGTGVRAWGRYIEAKFIHDHVMPVAGKRPVTTIRDLARHMGKSESWVSRLKDAYEFAQRYVEHVDAPDAMKQAAEHFSTLEEISKSTKFGKLVRAEEAEELRAEVFDMVRNEVFKEYRDARFMQQFYDDPEKWSQLKSHEKNIANRLANELKAGSSSIHVKISSLPNQVERALERDADALGEEDLEYIQRAARALAAHLADVGAFRLQLREFTKALQNVSLADLKNLTHDEFAALRDGLDDFYVRLDKHKTWN